ncbi:MAG: signal peptidase I [Actinomycetales bacterium]|nr:signal peptidase I [Actinomycetales bacterium]
MTASASATASPGATPSPGAADSPGVDPDRAGGGGQEPARRGVIAAAREIAVVVVVALGLSLLIKTFLVQAFFIPSESMENTMVRGDRLLVTKLAPGPLDLRRGDIVVFKDPGDWLGSADAAAGRRSPSVAGRVLTFVGLLPSDAGQHLVKRVIGLPGDRVRCCDADGRITVNGAPISEPYLKPGSIPSGEPFDQVVPTGRLWVMGDNRQRSGDSRAHQDGHGGTVPVDNVVGRAFVIVWPIGRATWFDRPTEVFSGVPAP